MKRYTYNTEYLLLETVDDILKYIKIYTKCMGFGDNEIRLNNADGFTDKDEDDIFDKILEESFISSDLNVPISFITNVVEMKKAFLNILSTTNKVIKIDPTGKYVFVYEDKYDHDNTINYNSAYDITIIEMEYYIRNGTFLDSIDIKSKSIYIEPSTNVDHVLYSNVKMTYTDLTIVDNFKSYSHSDFLFSTIVSKCDTIVFSSDSIDIDHLLHIKDVITKYCEKYEEYITIITNVQSEFYSIFSSTSKYVTVDII